MLTFAIVYSAALVAGIIILAILLRKASQSALPNLATAAGILGTFIGIVLGLWGFEVSNIEGSIPDLLNGLEFAFLTSIIGLIVAVVIRICFIVAGRKPSPEPVGDKIDKLAKILEDGFGEADTNAAALTEAVNNFNGPMKTRRPSRAPSRRAS